MKVYVVLYDDDYDGSKYLGVYSSTDNAEKSIKSDIIGRHNYSESDGTNYYKCLRSWYNIIEEELE